MKSERILSEQRDIHEFFEKTADHAFKEKAQLRQDYHAGRNVYLLNSEEQNR